MTESTPAHNLIGITDERNDEILNDVIATMTEEKQMDAGIKKLAEKYDPEALLVGMRLMQLMAINNRLHRTTISRQNADLN